MPKYVFVPWRLWLAVVIFSAQPVQALTVTYNTVSDVPLTADSIAPGTSVDFTLNFAPATGTNLMVMNNAGLGFISGAFTNLAQGQIVGLTHGGVTYKFLANYFGGTGNDLVLQWAGTRLTAWGFNDVGQLGHDTSPNDFSTAPVAVDRVDPPGTGTSALTGKRVIASSAGLSHSLALCSDGTIASWGLNDGGQLGDGTMNNQMVPVAVLKPGDIAGKTFIAVSAGSYHSLALCSDGTVVAWGENHDGQLGNATTDSSLVPVKVDTSGVLAGKTVVAIAAGLSHSLALCSDGTIVAWGLNVYGQLGDGTESLPDHASPVPVEVVHSGVLSGKIVVAIAAGSFHSLALCSDGTLAAWGSHLYGQLGDGSPISLSAHSDVPVLVSGTGPGGTTVVAVSAGYYHSLALCSDGTLKSWGDNLSGQLGNNGATPSNVPVDVINSGVLLGKTVTSVSCGSYYSMALCSSGATASWGDNDSGQLGNATLDDSPVPVLVSSSSLASGERFTVVASGQTSNHAFALVALPPPPPVVTTLAATSVTATSAVLNGTVIANDSSTAVTFDYGTGVSYGANIAAAPSPVTGSSATGVSATVPGLSPATTYHFRVHGASGAGAADGNDLTFATPSNDSRLSNLVLSPGSLTPGFATATLNYTARVSHSVASVTVTPTVAESHATVKVNGTPVASGSPSGAITLSVGDNPIIAEVTAQDGTTMQSYSVMLTRESAIQSWRQMHFGTPDNNGTAHDDSDPNHNGLTNLLEYGLDGDPVVVGAPGVGVLPAVAVGGSNHLQLSFVRRLDHNDITLTVQAADTLTGPWSDLAASVNGATFSGATVVETGSGNTRTVTVGDVYLVSDPGHPTRFMRLRVTNPNP